MKIEKRKLALFFGIVCLFYIPFNVSLRSVMYPGNLIYTIPILGCILIYLYQTDFKINTNLHKNKFTGFLLWSVLYFIIFIRNCDVAKGVTINVLYLAIIFIVMLILNNNVEWFEMLWKVIRIYCCIHLFAGFFLLINKNILISYVIPHFNVGENTLSLLGQCINNGYMTGLTYHYSTMGMYMSLGTIAFSGVIFDSKRKKKKSEWLIFILMLLGLFLTGKRGPLIFAVISITIVYFCTNKIKNKKVFVRTSLGIIAFIAMFFIAYISIPQVRSVIERFTSSSDNLNDFSSGRIEYFWVKAINMFQDRPLLGNGWRAFRYKITSISTLNANDAHNIYLQLLAEVGLIGFCIAAAFFVTAWYKTFKAIKLQKKMQVLSNTQEISLIISLCYQTYFLLYGFTGNPLYDMQCYFPYFVSCIMGYCAFNFLKKVNVERNA